MSSIIEVSAQLKDMASEGEMLVASMEAGPLKDLAIAFMESRFFPAFCISPAAQYMHQNYPGGLMEHSLGVAHICLNIAKLHKEVNRSLIIAGALFHDIGKIKELCIKAGIQYTDEGKLLGHTVLGIQILSEIMEGFDMPPGLKNQILHMVASHHGKHEWQAPVRPKFLEAMILHLADMMDAEIWKFKSAKPAKAGSCWSDYMKNIGSEVFLGN